MDARKTGDDDRNAAGSLRNRFLLVFVLIFVVGAAASYSAIQRFQRDLVRTLGGWFAEKSVLYEKSRVLQLMLREITLSEKMAHSRALIEWARDEQNARSRAAALADIEDFREFFRSRSYFFIFVRSGNYYFNDDKGGHPVDRPRYTLSESNADDQWLYATLRRGLDYELNVDTDRHLKVTKVWINTVLRDRGKPLAVLGTGLDLTDVIRTVITSDLPGVTNLLLDRNGAIQAHQDVSIIDFASISKQARNENQSTVFDLVPSEAQRKALQDAMAQLATGQGDTRSLELDIQGKRHVAGVAYLPQIHWFIVTLTQPESAADGSNLTAVALVLVAALALTLLIAGFAFNELVLRRLALLAAATRGMERGRYTVEGGLPAGNDELGRLSRAFRDMAGRIQAHTGELESQVAERTRSLERLAQVDYLTGLLNRRGMTERIEAECSRLVRTGGSMGVILLDLDHFKEVNDRHGHAAGDKVLVCVAELLREGTRAYDLCGRWGGEEFLVALPGVPGSAEVLAIAEKLRLAIRSRRVTVDGREIAWTASLGCSLVLPSASVDEMVAEADGALYEAKQAGRDRVVLAA